MKKNDFILIGIFVAIAAVFFVIIKCVSDNDGAMVEVVISGEITQTFPLDEDTEYLIEVGEENYNLLVISDGAASITKADCPDKLCVKQKSIDSEGESLICLPHKVVVRIAGGNDSQVDAVAN